MTTDTVEIFDAETLLNLLLQEWTDEEIVSQLGPNDAWLAESEHGPVANLKPGKWTVRRFGSRHLNDAAIKPATETEQGRIERYERELAAKQPGETALLCNDDHYCQSENAFPHREAWVDMCEALGFDPDGCKLGTITKRDDGLWRDEIGQLWEVIDGATVKFRGNAD